MTLIIPGLTGQKMSASVESSKIDPLDDEDTVKKKISGAFCPEGVVENNGVLAFLKHVIFSHKGSVVVERSPKFGGNKEYKSYEDIESDFVNKKLHPMDLKNALAKEVNLLLAPVRK